MSASEISVSVGSGTGSSKRRSIVTLTTDETGEMRMRCTCAAATKYGDLCRHRLQVAAGDIAFAADQPDVDLIGLRALVRQAPWYKDAHRLFGMEERREGASSMEARELRTYIATKMNGFPPQRREKKEKAKAAAGINIPVEVRSRTHAGTTYVVTLTAADESGRNMRLRCTCPAASTSGYLCHHRQKIATGDLTDTVKTAGVDTQLLARLLPLASWWNDIMELERIDSGDARDRSPRERDLRLSIAAAMNGYAPKPNRPRPDREPDTVVTLWANALTGEVGYEAGETRKKGRLWGEARPEPVLHTPPSTQPTPSRGEGRQILGGFWRWLRSLF